MGDLMKATGAKPTVNSSALHVFEVLRFVAETPEPLGVTEISRRLSLPVSTVFRALTTLEEAGYIQRYQNQPRFEIGTTPYLLNRALLNRFALHADSRATLYDLAQASEDTVSLWMRLGWYAVRIGGAFGRRDTYHHARLGDVAPLHEMPAGRAILASLGGEDRDGYQAYLHIHHPDRSTALPAHSSTALPAHSSTARPAPIEEQVGTEGFQATSIVIRDPEGAPIGALTSEGPFSAGDPLPERLGQARDVLEALVAANPKRYRSPFAHIAANDIRLDLARIGGEID